MIRPFNDVDLHAFVDGQVNADRLSAIATHLAASPGDAARVEAWQRQNDRIKALFAAVAAEPVPLWLTVGQLSPGRPPGDSAARDTRVSPMRAGEQKRLSVARRVTRQPSRTAITAVAFLAGAALTMGLDRMAITPGWLRISTAGTKPGEFARRALDARAAYGAAPMQPVDFAEASPERLQILLQDRVAFRTPVPDLRSSGWQLLGGRLVPDDVGRGVLLLYADSAGERLSLFMGQTSTAAVEPENQETAVSWTEDGVGYAWMSTGQEGWLSRNAEALRRAVEKPPG